MTVFSRVSGLGVASLFRSVGSVMFTEWGNTLGILLGISWWIVFGGFNVFWRVSWRMYGIWLRGMGYWKKVMELVGTKDRENAGSRVPCAKEYSFGLTKVVVVIPTHHLAKVVGIDTSTGECGDRVVLTLPLDL